MATVSADRLVSLSPPPDPAIGAVMAIAQKRPVRFVRFWWVLCVTFLTIGTAGSLALWIWGNRPPTTPLLLIGEVFVLLFLVSLFRLYWSPPPLVIGEKGFEARWTPRRLQVVTWDEVDALVPEGDKLRVVLRDRKAFFAHRNIGSLTFWRTPLGYPTIRLKMVDLPPREVADLLVSSFESWKADGRS